MVEVKKSWQKKKPPTEFEIQVGKRIRECRERLGLTTEVLAEALELSTSSIIQYELGIRSPSYDRFAALSKLLGVTTDYLLFGTSVSDSGADPEAGQLIKAFLTLDTRDKALVMEIIKSFVRTRPDDIWQMK